MQTRSTFTFVESAARLATQWRSITAYRLVRLCQCVSSTAQVSIPIHLAGAAGEELLGKILASLPAKALAQAEATCVQWYTSAPAIALGLCPVLTARLTCAIGIVLSSSMPCGIRGLYRLGEAELYQEWQSLQ